MLYKNKFSLPASKEYINKVDMLAPFLFSLIDELQGGKKTQEVNFLS